MYISYFINVFHVRFGDNAQPYMMPFGPQPFNSINWYSVVNTFMLPKCKEVTLLDTDTTIRAQISAPGSPIHLNSVWHHNIVMERNYSPLTATLCM